ncbi:hypothetical protein QE368_001069 [Asaia bogorensis NBRC 16594]|nr:hypothetical protein [Asaia bogorensis NBRC 16594]
MSRMRDITAACPTLPGEALRVLFASFAPKAGNIRSLHRTF